MTTDQKTRKKRPNGKNLADYAGHEKWSPRQWAWAFIRRNDKFIAACRALAPDDERRKREIASEFGLKKFKDYREGFRGGSGAPKFGATSVDRWSNVGAVDAEGRAPQVRLRAGQVMIRFDLAAAMAFKGALTAQIEAASTQLERLQQQFIATAGLAALKSGAARRDKFLPYMRILDLLASGHSHDVTLRLVNPDAAEAHRDDLRDQKKAQIRAARTYADSQYLLIAGMRPDKKQGK